MNNLAEYLAHRTAQEITRGWHKIRGQPVEQNGVYVRVWNDVTLSFEAEGRKVRVFLENTRGDSRPVERLVESVDREGISFPIKFPYSKVVRDINFYDPITSEPYVEVSLAPRRNSSGRATDERVFDSLYKTTILPLFGRIHRIG